MASAEEAVSAGDACGTNDPTASTELVVHPHSRAKVTADCAVYSTNITNVMVRDRRRLLEHQGSARCEQLGGFYRAKEKFNGVAAVLSYLF
jgi:hypothetical protein